MEYEIDKEEVKILLSKSLSRAWNYPIKVVGLELSPIKQIPCPTKSLIKKISDVEYKIEYKNMPKPNLPLNIIPKNIVVKKYFERVERASGSLKSCREEYEMEKAILSEELSCSINGREIKVYPRCYSKEVPECNDGMYIFREFIDEEMLEKRVQRLSKEGKLFFENINGFLPSLALLHVKTPFIIDRIPRVRENRPGTHNIVNNIMNYVYRIALEKDEEIKKNMIEERLKEPVYMITHEYLAAKRFLSAIDGDLDSFSHHLTTSMLLDAGSVQEGAFVRDLAVFGAPIFNEIENIERKAAEEYVNIRNTLSEILKSDEQKIELKMDDIVSGIYAAAALGNIRKPACAINYMLKNIECPDKNDIEKTVVEHISQSYKYLGYLQRNGRHNISTAAKRIETALEELGISPCYKIKKEPRITISKKRYYQE